MDRYEKNIMCMHGSCIGIGFFAGTGASAEEITYALGDVDMDGVVTGHDTAMVSRYVLDDTYTLTEEQLKLADVNEDGTVDQADADKLYTEMQVYPLGDVDMNGKCRSVGCCGYLDLLCESECWSVHGIDSSTEEFDRC